MRFNFRNPSFFHLISVHFDSITPKNLIIRNFQLFVFCSLCEFKVLKVNIIR